MMDRQVSGGKDANPGGGVTQPHIGIVSAPLLSPRPVVRRLVLLAASGGTRIRAPGSARALHSLGAGDAYRASGGRSPRVPRLSMAARLIGSGRL